MPSLSRLAQYTKDGVAPEMPPIGIAHYLIACLWEAGPTLSGDMGDKQITHGEIAHYQTNMGIELQPWEITILRRLSLDHLGQSQLSIDPNCRPPFGDLYRNPNIDARIDALFD